VNFMDWTSQSWRGLQSAGLDLGRLLMDLGRLLVDLGRLLVDLGRLLVDLGCLLRGRIMLG
jgi:hypothetical protein